MSKQGRIPLLWRHHVQSLEASLYDRRKGKKIRKKDLTAKTLADLWKQELSIPSRPGQQNRVWGGSAPRPRGAEEQWQVTALLLPLGIPLSGQDFGHEARLLQQPRKSSPLNLKCLLLCPPFHKVLCEMRRGLQDFASGGGSPARQKYQCYTEILQTHLRTFQFRITLKGN